MKKSIGIDGSFRYLSIYVKMVLQNVALDNNLCQYNADNGKFELTKPGLF